MAPTTERLLDTATYDLGNLLDSLESAGKKETWLKCNHCNFSTTNLESLMIHEKLVHDMTFFTCSDCGRQTKTEEYHKQMKHVKIKTEELVSPMPYNVESVVSM